MRETSTLFLAARGFACVAMDGLSVREQAALFERAEIVVAPHRATLTNLIPAREGAAVVELFPPRHIEASHFATASDRKLWYRYVVGEEAPPGLHGGCREARPPNGGVRAHVDSCHPQVQT